MHRPALRYARGVSESTVDLTYRGLALGKRIPLAEVRPTSALVEIATPMPVGTQLAITTDDGLTLEASVVWVHEQVAGAERPPGMIVAPVLAAEAAIAWWKERVTLPDLERPRAPTRSRPVTLRPRPQTERTRQVTDRTPPPAAALADAVVADEITVAEATPVPPVQAPPAPSPQPADQAADLAARVTSAAGVRPQAPPPERQATEADERATVAMSALQQAKLVESSRPTHARTAIAEDGRAEPARSTGEYAVVDDGNRTTIMEAVDPASLGLDVPTGDGTPSAIGEEPSAPTIIIESGEPGGPTESHEAAAISDEADGDGEPTSATQADKTGRAAKRRRKRR